MRKNYYLSILLCLLPFMLFAQTHEISGTVTDSATGGPIAKVTVTVMNSQGKTGGTLTDDNGHYILNADTSALEIVFSYVGYGTINEPVNQRTTINAAMVNNGSDLNDVVVVGYGTSKKAVLTGSVAAITGKDVVTTKTDNFMNTLSGKLPGIRIVQNTSEPGTFNNTYDIRGFSASGSGGKVSPPLIIIDGVPQDQSVLQRLDPQDIDNISILKDASAAIYGVQAANGVILVTTKRGQKGQVQISYNVTAMDQVVNQQPDETNAVQWIRLMNEKSMHNIDNPTQTFDDDFTAPYANGTLPSTSWVDATMNHTAPEWQHSLTASGGSDNINYYISVGYQSQNGFFINNAENYNKYNFRSNIDAKISKRLRLSMQLSGISDVQHKPASLAWEIYKSMWRNAPIVPVFADEQGQLYNNPAILGYGLDNTVAEVTPSQSGYDLNKSPSFQGGLSLTYDVPYIDGLQAKAFYNYNYSVMDNKTYNRGYNIYSPGAMDGTYVSTAAGGVNGQSQASNYYGQSTNGYLRFSLDYNHTFAGVHNVEALLLYEQNSGDGTIFSASRFESLNSDQLSAGDAANQVGSGIAVNPSRSKSYVGKLHYDYKTKYIVDFTIRRDGSSLFPPSKPYGVFPAVTSAYRISQEPFFKNLKALSFINDFKIRGSYGLLGDASGTNGYNFVGGYDYPAGNANIQGLSPGSVFNGDYINGLGFRGLTNPNITWYTAKTFDVGIDVDMWNSLFSVTADYYNRNRSGLLATELLNLPGSVGATLPQENLNSDQTRGYELSITNTDHFGKLTLRLSGNVSYARTKWLDYIKAAQGSDYADWVNNGNLNGRYNDVWFGQGYMGQFQSFDQIRNYQINQGGGNRALVPGDYIYEDWNHDGYFDNGDLHPVAGTNAVNSQGTPTPTAPIVNFGFTVSASYEGFDLTALFQGVAGKWISYPEYYITPVLQSGNSFSKFLDDWHPADPTANPYDPNTAYVPGYYAYTGTVVNTSSTGPGGINNASYVRLKSLEIGYTIPDNILKKTGVKSLRVFANGYDLFTITGLKGVDPEHPSDLYGYQYPLNHIFSFGLNAKF